jgi:hypothetical protein
MGALDLSITGLPLSPLAEDDPGELVSVKKWVQCLILYMMTYQVNSPFSTIVYTREYS